MEKFDTAYEPSKYSKTRCVIMTCCRNKEYGRWNKRIKSTIQLWEILDPGSQFEIPDPRSRDPGPDPAKFWASDKKIAEGHFLKKLLYFHMMNSVIQNHFISFTDWFPANTKNAIISYEQKRTYPSQTILCKIVRTKTKSYIRVKLQTYHRMI